MVKKMVQGVKGLPSEAGMLARNHLGFLEMRHSTTMVET